MQTVFDNFGVIVGFMILCIGINTIFNNEVLNEFLLLVLFSIVVLNADSFVKFINPKE